MTPRIGEDFVRWTPPTGGDETLGLVDFSIFPHLDHEDMPDNSMAGAEAWAAGMSVPAYAIDDRDRHQSDRRHRRSRLRGALEAVYPLTPMLHVRANLHYVCTFCYRVVMQEPTGLRERKKAETRTALSQAVLRLALERGLDAVTADDIAAAANVSVRTFHNYFGTKEEALVAAWRSEFQVYVDALRDRPADEPILVSLEHVFSRHRVQRRSTVADGHRRAHRPALDEPRDGALPLGAARRGDPHDHRRRRSPNGHRRRDRRLSTPA